MLLEFSFGHNFFDQILFIFQSDQISFRFIKIYNSNLPCSLEKN